MGNELTNKPAGALANTSDFYELFAQEGEKVRDGGDYSFLKFDGNTGEYSYGQNNEELPTGSLLAVNVESYQKGWICWNDGEVMGEVMVGLGETVPAKSSLENHGPYVEENDGWSEQYKIQMRMMDEPHTNLLFQANNRSKRIAFENFMRDFSKGFRMHPDDEGFCVPIIEIDEVEFEGKAKEGKRKYRKHAPIFKIVDWRPKAELAALTEGSPEDYESEEVDEHEARTARRSTRDDDDDRGARRSASSRDEDDDRSSRRSARQDDTRSRARDDEGDGDDRDARREEPRSRRRASF